MATVHRALVVPLADSLSTAILSLFADYRLLTNEVLREALRTGQTSLGSMDRFARTRALHHQLTGQHALAAAAIALSLAKGHRRRLRLGKVSSVPWVRRAFLRTGPTTFHLEASTGKVRLSLRRGEWTSLHLHLAPYHRKRLAAPNTRVKQLHLTEHRAVLILESPVPEPSSPKSLLALDTNEVSLDGVTVTAQNTTPARIQFRDVPLIQARHAGRRRRLAKKKATDRRVGRRLLGREGRRERNRVRSRLHALTRKIIEVAVRNRAAIAVEDLSRLSPPRRRRKTRGFSSPRRFKPSSSKFRRRMSSWPRGELHRQLLYKAAQRGVTVYRVNPFRTSVTCPRCGGLTYPRSRVRPKFTCASCGWSLDRQINAGVNLARTVLRDYGRTELGGLRLDLDALSQEVVRPRYPFAKSKGQGRSVRRGREIGSPIHVTGLQ